MGIEDRHNTTSQHWFTCLALLHNCCCQLFLSAQSGGESPIHIAAKYGTIRALELIWEWCDVFGKEGEKGGKFEPFVEPDEVSLSILYKRRKFVVEALLLSLFSAERLDSPPPCSSHQPRQGCGVAVGYGKKGPDQVECRCYIGGVFI